MGGGEGEGAGGGDEDDLAAWDFAVLEVGGMVISWVFLVDRC